MIPKRFLFLSVLSLLAACGGDAPTEPQPTPTADAAAAFALAADPGAAITVLEAKDKGPGDATLVVQGRIQDITKGFAIVKLMDTELKYCGEVHAEGCKTPWDYCCDTAEAHREHELLVEFRGPDGMPVETAGLPDTRLLDLMKVRGKMTENEHGSLVLVADGLWQVERPELPDGLNWPQ
jgi:hypothetical protein